MNGARYESPTRWGPWKHYLSQVPITPGVTYAFGAWARPLTALTDGRFGVPTREDGSPLLDEAWLGATPDYANRQITVTVPDDVRTVTVYTGFAGSGTDTLMQIGDVTIDRR